MIHKLDLVGLYIGIDGAASNIAMKMYYCGVENLMYFLINACSL